MPAAMEQSAATPILWIAALLTSNQECTLKKIATLALGSLMAVGAFSAAHAADIVRTAPPPPPATVVVQPVHTHLHDVLWCVGGVAISVAIHNPAPGIVGCAIGVVHWVHRSPAYATARG